MLIFKVYLNSRRGQPAEEIFDLQLNQRSKGDWASACFDDLKQLRITQSLEEIRDMNQNKYVNLLNFR